MAVTFSLTTPARDARRGRRAALLEELSVVSRDVDVLDGLEVPDELRPSIRARAVARDLDVGLSGWQRGLGVAVAFVVVILMIMATSLLLTLLLCLSAAAALGMVAAVVADALHVCAGRVGWTVDE